MAGTNTIKQQAAGAGATGEGQAKAALQVFAGGACYGAMATTYKLAYAAGFTSAQVVASQAWFGCLFFALATLAGHALGHRWQRVGWRLALKLMGLGALTCLTSILYCYAMSVLPAPVALTLLFQFTWLGLVWQTVMTRRPPRVLQVASALVIVFGTVFASGVYKTGITGYDPVALLCALGAAVSCSLFVTLSGKVEAPCSSEQRGVIVCAGSVIMSLTVCPDYVVSGVLAQGILPFAVIAGFFGMLCPVLLFGMGSPHLPAGLSTVMAAAELPAGLLIAMIVLGEPLGDGEARGKQEPVRLLRLRGVGAFEQPSSLPACAWHRSPPCLEAGRHVAPPQDKPSASHPFTGGPRASGKGPRARRVRSQGRYKASPAEMGAPERRRHHAISKRVPLGRSHRRQPMRGRL